MCGRYALFGDFSALATQFDLIHPLAATERYNIAPGQFNPVIQQNATGERSALLARWGLLPSWVKDPASMAKPINAKSETAACKPMFRHAMRRKRILVPVSGFYEWKAIAGRKQPYFFQRADHRPFAFAGLLEHWSGFEGEIISYCILTTTPNETAAQIHDRMPVIIDEQDYAMWLDPALTNPDVVRPLLAPYLVAPMTVQAVSRRVNRATEDDPALIEEVVEAS